MPSARRAFVVMPFGAKPGPDGKDIDFDAIYEQLLAPAVKDAGLDPHRADADRRGGSIHADMFQDLLLAEFVVADLTIDNPNVWYEIGVRHALRSSGAVLTYALRDRLPFDIAGQRMQRYSLAQGKLVAERLADERRALAEAITATLGAWRGRKGSPVYQQLPNLIEPDWKRLKVGDVNQFWQALDDWRGRIEIAKRKQRPGDILLLAEETPNRVLELEALRIAADALIKVNRPGFALTIAQRARALDPDDIEARRLEGVALGRSERYEEARVAFQRLAELRRNGEILGLLARTWKDEWLRSWNAHPQRQTDPLAAARDTATTLRSAVEAYDEAFRADPANFYPGVNVLTLGRLWRHVTGRKGRRDLEGAAAGVGWAIECALDRGKDYWALVSRAELALVSGNRDAALDDYAEAAALAVSSRDRFALDSSGQTLDFLSVLGFQKEIVTEAARIIDSAERQLDAMFGALAEQTQPERVVLFSGHMIDDPAVRGPGKAKPARFPAALVEAASARIAAALDAIGAGTGDLGLCGGACGGDLLFAEACLKRGMRLEVRLARPEAEFLAESVTFADADHRWERSFAAVTSNPATTVLAMPDELGPAPEDVDVHERCSRWMLNSALSRGLKRLSFVTVWDGAPGDGPGGTENMVELVRKLTGRPPIIIDPYVGVVPAPERQERTDEQPLSPPEPGIVPSSEVSEIARYYVSYAWSDPSDSSRETAVDKFCNEAQRRGVKIFRDKEILRPGDQISSFMQKLGEADHIYIFLSEKYLKSPFCMYELFEMWKNCKQNKNEFLRHVMFFNVDGTKINKPVEWLSYTSYWIDERNELSEKVKLVGPEYAGEEVIKRLRIMNNFVAQVSDILALFADTVQAKTFDDFLAHGFDVRPGGENL